MCAVRADWAVADAEPQAALHHPQGRQRRHQAGALPSLAPCCSVPLASLDAANACTWLHIAAGALSQAFPICAHDIA